MIFFTLSNKQTNGLAQGEREREKIVQLLHIAMISWGQKSIVKVMKWRKLRKKRFEREHFPYTLSFGLRIFFVKNLTKVGFGW